MIRISYIELPAADFAATGRFYTDAFGRALQPFGPSYAATVGDDVDLGLQGDAAEASAAPLVLFEVDDLDAQITRVEAAGGIVTRPIFAFPGGRRFHFRDPAGNELAVFEPDAAG